MSFSLPYLIAPVVYEFVWNLDDTSKETSTYTTTYFNAPGPHTAYALVVNTALPSPSQIETIGIPYTIAPGGVSTQHVSATVATHRPTTPVLQVNHALVTPATDSSVQTSTLPKVPCHKFVPGSVLSLHESYSTYLQIILVCLVCGGYLWVRYLRHLRRKRETFEEGRGIFLSQKKSAIYELA
ncbi:unnamed protein product [Aureobasidium uvarum]|uniref:Uncharacterized protein n=1 Tax=Aureobasidium uvarum TaxID=2773716 RepID=A0A9N8KQM5_9PEZI|nr:unnamed protein product [Aureobasidium uvarum]